MHANCILGYNLTLRMFCSWKKKARKKSS